MFEDSEDSPNPSRESILEKVIFYKAEDSECGTIIWRYLEESYSIHMVSNRSFDTIEEALEAYLESRKGKFS